MSDILQEKTLKEVVLNHDDIKNLREFFTHFKISMIAEMEEILARWEMKKDKVTPQDQQDLKVALCAQMLQSDHPMFKDELFKPILENSSKIVFDAQFEKELETQLSSSENT